MPLTKDNDILFIHIPKTGGTSIEKILKMREFPSEKLFWVPWYTDIINGVNYSPQHFTSKILKDRIVNYNDLYKFTFVRNPYTRLLSEYFWDTKYTIFCPIHFQEWTSIFLSNIDTDHKLPQVNYVPSDIDFVGKFETLQTDFNNLISILGYQGDFTLPHYHRNTTNTLDLISKINKETLEIIQTVYKDDFLTFGYSF